MVQIPKELFCHDGYYIVMNVLFKFLLGRLSLNCLYIYVKVREDVLSCCI